MKTKVLPPTFFLITLFLLIVFHYILPIYKIIYAPYRWIGISIIIFGIFMNLWTDALLKKEKTTVKPNEKPTALIIYGPFRLSRHPMYLGMAAILLGAAIFLGSVITFILPIIFVILIQILFIPVEEKI